MVVGDISLIKNYSLFNTYERSQYVNSTIYQHTSKLTIPDHIFL